MRYFLKLAYDGAGFHGWQAQPNACSVQQSLEKALAVVLRHDVNLTGAGRTDTGVNARVMYAHFDTDQPIDRPDKFLLSLNRLTPKGILIQNLITVHEEAHARFDATEREYKYFIIFEDSPFLRKFAWYSPAELNVERMNEAAECLLSNQDFTSFAKLHSDSRTNICDVRQAIWTIFENPYGVDGIQFTIRADRFLRNMVRAVVGTLVDVGRGKLTVKDFRDIIKRKDRCAAGMSMPPQALFLWDIKYPFMK